MEVASLLLQPEKCVVRKKGTCAGDTKTPPMHPQNISVSYFSAKPKRQLQFNKKQPAVASISLTSASCLSSTGRNPPNRSAPSVCRLRFCTTRSRPVPSARRWTRAVLPHPVSPTCATKRRSCQVQRVRLVKLSWLGLDGRKIQRRSAKQSQRSKEINEAVEAKIKKHRRRPTKNLSCGDGRCATFETLNKYWIDTVGLYMNSTEKGCRTKLSARGATATECAYL